MTIAGLTGPVDITISGHSLAADLDADRRARLAELWRELAVGHLDRARGMRRDGDTVGAEQWEQAAADWCAAADVVEWGQS